MRTTIVLDNGASTVKAGLSVDGVEKPRVITNAVIRSKGDKMTYFGHEFAKCRDYSSLHYRLPFEKGYLVDWDAQKAVWDGVFSTEVLGIDTTSCSLLITEPYFNLPNLQEVYDQFMFEEYEFHSYYRCTPASLVPHGSLFQQPGLPPPDCALVIDAGFSFTHVIPLLNGRIIWNAVKRIDIGGKLLTNQLKELISFRQWNMMDETFIMNNVKETCCYVSMNYKVDLEACRLNPTDNPIVQEYVLPDLTTHSNGRIRHSDEIVSDTDQILFMRNERFSVPELLFRPDDIGLPQMGLPETIALSISLLPKDLQGMFWANIGLIGGTTKFPNFRERLVTELRCLAPAECAVEVYECAEPILQAYEGAHAFIETPEFLQRLVTKSEYAEMGSNATRRKFWDWRPHETTREKPKEHEFEESPVRGNKTRQRQDERAPVRARAKSTRS